jgi:sulfate adenylyltransferase
MGGSQSSASDRAVSGCVILLTGLSGAGKSTIAHALVETLTRESARPVTLLDGDQIRLSLSSELGFSREDRMIHLRRMGCVAAEVARRGGLAICAAIAPFSDAREAMRRLVEVHGTFIVAHIATPLHICEARDPKGLYARARAGLLDRLTGVSDPYEAPEHPDLSIDTSHVTAVDAAHLIMGRLRDLGQLRAHRACKKPIRK